MSYYVTRRYGRNRDILIGWDLEYGTVAGHPAKAIVFPDYDSARAAARKARRVCMGWNHAKGRLKRARGIVFEPRPARPIED